MIDTILRAVQEVFVVSYVSLLSFFGVSVDTASVELEVSTSTPVQVSTSSKTEAEEEQGYNDTYLLNLYIKGEIDFKEYLERKYEIEVDEESWVYLGDILYKDNNYVYRAGKYPVLLADADALTFEFDPTTGIARDKNKVWLEDFVITEVEEADPDSFKSIRTSDGTLLYQDKDNVYVKIIDAYRTSAVTLGEVILGDWYDLETFFDRCVAEKYCSFSPTGRYVYFILRDGNVTHMVDLQTGLNVISGLLDISSMNIGDLLWLSNDSAVVFKDSFSGVDGTGSESVYIVSLPEGKLIPIFTTPDSSFTSEDTFLKVENLSINGKSITFIEKRRGNCGSRSLDEDGYCSTKWTYDTETQKVETFFLK